jgi:hypothetical protein
MEDRNLRCSRRKFLASAAALTTLAGGHDDSAAADADGAEAPPLSRTRPAKPSRKGRKPLAVVTTVYRPLSHAYHIAGRFIHGYARGGRLHVPRHYVHSMLVAAYGPIEIYGFHALESHYRRGNRIETPELEVRYAAPADSGFLRGSIADA